MSILKEELVGSQSLRFSFPSPSGQEKEMADYVEAAMKRFGFDSTEIVTARNEYLAV